MKKLYASIVLSALMLACSIPSRAVTLSFVPEDQTKLLGETAFVDVMVGGLKGSPDEIVSAFDLSLIFDPAILQSLAVTLNAVPLMGGLVDTLYDVTYNSGRIDFSVTSLLTDDNAIGALQAGNNDPLTLARIYFSTIDIGTSELSFDLTSPTKVIVGRNATELSISHPDGSITVTANGQAPEPGTLPLLGIGILVWALTYRDKLRTLNLGE